MHYEYDLTRCTNKSRLGLIQDERIDLPPLVGISMMLSAMQHNNSCAVHAAMPKQIIPVCLNRQVIDPAFPND
jgi:hypothetical protein